MSELAEELSVGERIRILRDRRGMSRAVLAGLVGRSAVWLRKIESGERRLHSLPMIVKLARALHVSDVSELMGAAMSAPVDQGGRVSHPYVAPLRDAIHAPLFGRPLALPESVEVLSGRVAQAWRTWHMSPMNRTETGSVLPELLSACQAAVRRSEGDERRRAHVVLASAYGLAQMFAAHITEPELYWLTVDRARNSAEESDDPARLAMAAWVMANGLSASGYTEECIRLLTDAAASLRPLLEEGSDDLRGVFGSVCLKAAITHAQDGEEGSAWRWWDEASKTAKLMPGYLHPETAFGSGNCAVHAVTMGVELKTPGAALKKAEETNPEGIESLERRSRLYVDAARSQWARKEGSGALHYLSTAFEMSPECVRYVPPARALAAELALKATGTLKGEAVALAEAVGVLAA
ncbi:helix-turn-helix domain-containing protein [Streptacidiphilus cavernicola]|uniref:Helix-turn-helix domain-containing protein n=1 Tax=Streptacidiphilus cavernicola TaxID=3342716 RepID=A0ABV6W2Z6_9ACTN